MKTRNPAVGDVVQAFGRIRRRGHYLAAWDGGVFTGNHYTARLENKAGFNNHFQGMVRLGRHVVLSGGDAAGASELYVVDMGSRKATQPFRSNLWQSLQPSAKDRAVTRVRVDSKLWHAGGIDASGDLVAVPLEGQKGASRVVFYDFTDPEAPAPVPAAAVDRSVAKASAAAFARRPDDRFVLAVWGYTKSRYLDFYLSRTDDLGQGWDGPFRVVLSSRYDEVEYQAVHFVTQRDGRLFLLGFENTSHTAPTTPGEDIVHLWEVTLPSADPAAGAWPGLAMHQVTWGEFTGKDRQANMDAGAAAWVDPSGELHLYSCYHWRQDGMIRFSEFRAQRDAAAAPISRAGDGWIDLFEHSKYAGHCLSLAGPRGSDIRQYEHIHVEGSNFNDRVSSVRYQLPPNHRYRLYEHADYQGAQLDLVGDGTVREIESFTQHAGPLPGDRVSSSRWVAPGG